MPKKEKRPYSGGANLISHPLLVSAYIKDNDKTNTPSSRTHKPLVQIGPQNRSKSCDQLVDSETMNSEIGVHRMSDVLPAWQQQKDRPTQVRQIG